MKSIFSRTLLAAMFLAPAIAGAWTADFTARVNNVVNFQPGPPFVVPKLVAVAIFDDFDLTSRGSVTLFFKVTDPFDNDAVLFDGSATINSTQTQVNVGNANTGRITLTWDVATQHLEARFALNLTGHHARVDVHDGGVNWTAGATIGNVFPL